MADDQELCKVAAGQIIVLPSGVQQEGTLLLVPGSAVAALEQDGVVERIGKQQAR